nr:MAG TPA: hypothetical protein [Bacteriophage sp.]
MPSFAFLIIRSNNTFFVVSRIGIFFSPFLSQVVRNNLGPLKFVLRKSIPGKYP